MAPGEQDSERKVVEMRMSRPCNEAGHEAASGDIQISFIIPCYNETPEILADTLRNLHAAMDAVPISNSEVIVVDDGTTRYDYRQSLPFDRERLVRHKKNRGYGASLSTGIGEARYDWIGIVDADGTYPVGLFPSLIERAGEYDMVVGSRSWGSIPWVRRPTKWLLGKVAGSIAGVAIPDLNSGMRIFRREIAQAHPRIFPSGFSFTSTLTMICMTEAREVAFVDIPYSVRTGDSKIHPLRDTVGFFALLLRLSLYFRPLRFFMPLTAVILLAAMGRGIRDVWVGNHFGGLTLVLFFAAFQVFFFGLLAEIINKK